MDTLPYELLVDAFKYTSKIPLLFESTKTLKYCAYFLDHQAIILKNFDFSENWNHFNVVAVKNDRYKKLKIRKNGTIKNMPKRLLYLNIGFPFDDYKYFKKSSILPSRHVKYLSLNDYRCLDNVSSNVTHYFHNSELMHQLPQFSKSLTHLNVLYWHDGIKLPKSLTHLSIDGYGHFPIEFPEKLKKLKIGEYITCLFDKFPIGLTYLNINQSSHFKLPKWPITLISLNLGHGIKISEFPIFLTYLSCDSGSIKDLKWPAHLTHLSLSNMKHITYFPKNLDYLYIYSPRSYQFDSLPLCPFISIEMGYADPTLKLKNNIKKLDLGSSFAHCRMNIILDSITKLDLVYLIIHYNNTENDVVTWLNNLTDVDMTKLTHLKLTGCYRKPINKLPQTITHLIFTSIYETIIQFPSNLKFLNTNAVKCPSILPTTLQYLSHSNIVGFVLPRSLRCIRTQYKHFDLIPAFVKFVVLI